MSWSVPSNECCITVTIRSLRPTNPSASTSSLCNHSNLFEFITNLGVAGRYSFTPQELMILPSMQNLGVLELIKLSQAHESQNFPQVTHSMLELWSLTEKLFPKLLMLKVESHMRFTTKSLLHADKFPMLTLFSAIGQREG